MFAVNCHEVMGEKDGHFEFVAVCGEWQTRMEIGMTERPTLNDGSGWALNPECFYLKLP